MWQLLYEGKFRENIGVFDRITDHTVALSSQLIDARTPVGISAMIQHLSSIVDRVRLRDAVSAHESREEQKRREERGTVHCEDRGVTLTRPISKGCNGSKECLSYHLTISLLQLYQA